MYALEQFIPAIISSGIAAVAIMLAAEFVEHNLEWKHAIIMAVVANLATSILTPLLLPFVPVIAVASMNLTGTIVNLLFWIALAMVIMKESYTKDKIKIAVYGFIATQATLYLLNLFGIW
jgi:uncharacterized membrane protein